MLDYTAQKTDEFQYADTITAEITIDELEVCGHFLSGEIKAIVLHDQLAEDNGERAYYPLDVVNINGLEWIDTDGNDQSVSKLEISAYDVLQALQAYSDRFDDALNSKNVRETI